MTMWVSHEELVGFTHLKRYSAQARVLDHHGIKHTRRPDGSIALRREELDAHTLTAPNKAKAKREWRPDLSAVGDIGKEWHAKREADRQKGKR